jgi:5-(carboxyamino)imidazole ribonucleotide synthase
MRIGVIGGGQLGRMLGLAAIPLGMRCRFLDPSVECPAAAAGDLVVGAYDDPGALASLVDDVDLVTYEFENVPASAARLVAERAILAPGPRSLEIAQDRIAEKDFFRSVGVPVQPYHAVASDEELREAVETIGFPAVLKTRRLGYDGKGQAVVRSAAAAGPAWASLDRVPCIYEAFVPFDREVSIVATRGADGSCVFSPLVRNEHRDGILRLSIAPDPEAHPILTRSAQSAVRAILDGLGHVGTLAVEFFVVGEGLVANEMAPRVHNSGHWSIEGATTSQFENHLRAITGLPLGDPTPRGCAAMVNLIGAAPERDAILAIPGARLHLYGKTPRPGRKVGHVTLLGEDPDAIESRLSALRALADAATARLGSV